MDSVISIEAARTLVADTVLWPRVRGFLWDFALQVHPSWLDDVNGISGLPVISGSSRTKAYILSSLGVEPCFHDFPKGDWSRLALLDGETLLSIVKWLGALACADELRRVTSGATVRELKAELSGVYPEVFGFTAYFKGIDFQIRDIESQNRPSVVKDVVSRGVSVIFSLVGSLPEPLVSRLRLKLPKDLCDSTPLRLKPEACGKAFAKLLKLKFPEAYKICC